MKVSVEPFQRLAESRDGVSRRAPQSAKLSPWRFFFQAFSFRLMVGKEKAGKRFVGRKRWKEKQKGDPSVKDRPFCFLRC